MSHAAVADPSEETMFYCERCGTKFNPAAAGTQMACPRCRAVDGIYSPLTFGIFDAAEIRSIVKNRRRSPGAGAERQRARTARSRTRPTNA